MPPSDFLSDSHQTQNWELSELVSVWGAFEKTTMGWGGGP